MAHGGLLRLSLSGRGLIETPSLEIHMPQNNDLDKRRADVLHVQASNRLSGVQVSQYMAARMEEYTNGRLSSAELVAEAKIRHGVQKHSPPGEE